MGEGEFLIMDELQGRPVEAEWYPDVAADGSLATALAKAARSAGADVGEVEPMSYNVLQGAWMPSARGSILVSTVTGERSFSITMANNLPTSTTHQSQSWAFGESADLSDIVQAADAWRRGMKLRELHEAFPFMKYHRMALANEDGNAREVKWELLIESPGYAHARPLLEAARADEQLCRMWAVGSHTFWVYFEPRDGSGVVARVHLADDSYVIGLGGGWEDGDDSTTVHTVEEAVATVKALLDGHRPALTAEPRAPSEDSRE